MSGHRDAVAAEGVGRESRERVRERIQEVLGPRGLAADEGEEEGRPLPPAALPDSDEETGAVLRVAGEEGWRVLPIGRGLGQDLLPGGGSGAGPPSPSEPDLLLSTRRRRGVTVYEPDDLTFTAQAGTTLDELDRRVRAEGQWLLLDPPGGGARSLGGVTAGGVGGPLSAAFGRPRDQLLGLTLVDGRGRVLPLGGRVVKNVAGFDLVRLAAGSRGSLGVITSLSFRLYPLPRWDRTLVWELGDRSRAWELARSLFLLPLPLAALELLDGSWHESPGGEGPNAGDLPPGGSSGGVPGRGPRVVARILGSPQAGEAMVRELKGTAGSPTTVLGREETREAFAALSRLDGLGGTALRARALPHEGGLLLEAAGVLEEALALGGEDGSSAFRLALRVPTGELRVTGPGGEGPGADAGLASALEGFRSRVEEAGGTFRLLRAPAPVAGRVASATPASREVARLHGELRRAFDPRGVLPGAWREGWS